jgi:pyridoxal phosphate enzyme (YggS family)
LIGAREELEENLAAVRVRMSSALARSGRAEARALLVAMTKGVPPEVIAWAAEAGLTDVGENYVRELESKRAEVPGMRWHFVGSLQSHTSHRVAEAAAYLHSLVPGHAATRLAHRLAREQRRLPALLQVDFTGSRSGVAPSDLGACAREMERVPGLDLRGLMTLPPMPRDPEDSRPYFRRLRELRDAIGGADRLPELSMGLSADYEVALEEGATMLRVGSALFGARPGTRTG